MTEYLELPKPRELFTFSSDEMNTFREFGQIAFADFNINEQYELDTDLQPINEKHSDLTADVRSIVERCIDGASIMLPSHVILDIDTAPVLPLTAQRSPNWHVDTGMYHNEAIIFSDELPTMFAIGSLPKKHPIASMYESHMRSSLYGMHITDSIWLLSKFQKQIDKAIKKGDLDVYIAPKDTALAIDRRHLHKAQKNTTKAPVDRLFGRIRAVNRAVNLVS